MTKYSNVVIEKDTRIMECFKKHQDRGKSLKNQISIYLFLPRNKNEMNHFFMQMRKNHLIPHYSSKIKYRYFLNLKIRKPSPLTFVYTFSLHNGSQ